MVSPLPSALRWCGRCTPSSTCRGRAPPTLLYIYSKIFDVSQSLYELTFNYYATTIFALAVALALHPSSQRANKAATHCSNFPRVLSKERFAICRHSMTDNCVPHTGQRSQQRARSPRRLSSDNYVRDASSGRIDTDSGKVQFLRAAVYTLVTCRF